MSKADTSLNAEHVYICGNSGTGKSSHIKEKIAKAQRVIAFDPDDEYGELPGFTRVTSASQLVELLQAHKNTALKVAFVAEGVKAFEFWANCAFNWRNCVAVAEEIADVTTPSKAPPAWGRLIRRGRKYGILICAVTQRPAEADKTILCNAAVIRTCALGRDADRQAIAREINAHVSEIAGLKPLDWIEFKRADLSLIKGRLGQERTQKLKPAA
ncbi:hypothetical protein J7384_10210 [Endozoicomonas sp. G2_1]|uniref:hypothetical protein n=1 Tax=Endozoicomonas sp. G2_1 TaxID=2821091 RepID=UPI001ADB48F1|nr:hypothetical protein [Endozoicomonas sp. G2_1]MBO9490733.1 hypothetical protein [Endozoicomonas sp. G2_1]